MYRFADLHCDTLTTSFERRKTFFENNLHIDIKRLLQYDRPIQVFAIWLIKKYYADAFNVTNNMIDFFEKQIEQNEKYITKVTNFEEIQKNDKINAILSIEGGESIEDNLDNIDHFYNRGVRFMSLTWNYENNIGFGAFTKSKECLKPFGKEVVKRMNNVGMIVDVSHLNEAGFWEVCELTKKPFVATHSNAYNLCKHFRNLKDEQLEAIKEHKGLVGINLCPAFLSDKKNVSDIDVLRHIDYIGTVIGEDKVCFGSDFDGIEKTPINLEEISKFDGLFKKIEKIYGKDFLDKITHKNFLDFMEINIQN